MSLIATESGGSKIPPLEPDVYDAVCIAIIDLGTQKDELQGDVKSRRKVFVTWAVDGETVDIDGEAKPRVISREYPVSLHERARLRQDLEAWRGRPFTADELKGFDLRTVAGKPCRIQTGLTSGGNAKVMSLLKAKKNTQVPDEMSVVTFDLSEWDGQEIPEGIPNFVGEKIAESPEFREKRNGTAEPEPKVEPADSEGIAEGDCPF